MSTRNLLSCGALALGAGLGCLACDGAVRTDDAGPVSVDARASGLDTGVSALDASASETDAGVSLSDAAGASDAAGSGAAVGPRIADLTPSGPIELTSGQTVSGLHITSASGPCIRGSGVSDVHLVDNLIGPCGPDAEGVGISLEVASRVHIEHNAFDDVASALYLYADSDDVVFDHNVATRVRGPLPRGQLVQLNQVHGAGNRILCNVSDQSTPGYLEGPEDHVNIFSSAGTAASPIEIAYNRIRGGGPSASGGGLLAGDFGSEHVDIHDNLLVNPGQYGLAIAGGRFIRVVDNVVYAPDAFAWSNVGMYVWNQSPDSVCSDLEVTRNRVFYVNERGRNDAWNADNCGTVAGWDANVFGDEGLSLSLWDEPMHPACD